jgi:hypothetical protein
MQGGDKSLPDIEADLPDVEGSDTSVVPSASEVANDDSWL